MVGAHELLMVVAHALLRVVIQHSSLPGKWVDGLPAYAFLSSYLGQCRHLVSQETPLAGLCLDLHTLQLVHHCLVLGNCLVMVPCNVQEI